jgi:hypothetical protein
MVEARLRTAIACSCEFACAMNSLSASDNTAPVERRNTMACTSASTKSSCAALGNAHTSRKNSSAHGAPSGNITRRAEIVGSAAAARTSLSPCTFIGWSGKAVSSLNSCKRLCPLA